MMKELKSIIFLLNGCNDILVPSALAMVKLIMYHRINKCSCTPFACAMVH